MDKRLIEMNFPLRQASLDSVHEKNVRHGHISTLHIWPARRPLAASRAALIATLLRDPGNERERLEFLRRLGGKVVEREKPKKYADGRVEEQRVYETEDGILHWGRENNADLNWFRKEIYDAFGGRAPRVLDPFSGGGAIPLEAMRLGCEVTAVDINPVAWFILKCTLEYPQRLAGQSLPLPDFALESREFMETYFAAHGFKGAALETQLAAYGLASPANKQITGKGKSKSQPDQPELFARAAIPPVVEDQLAWHVRAWGWWVLQKACVDLERFYPTVQDKSTVAYLWARTVTCKNCRATIPLLKTRWLCKKEKKRIALTMESNADRSGVTFGILQDVPILKKGSAAQKREHDKKYAGGTMSRSGVACPCCNTIMTMEYLRQESKAGRASALMTAVVIDGEAGKEYRLPTSDEIAMAAEAEKELQSLFAEIPYGLPEEPLPSKETLGFRVPLYGFDQWYKLFNHRQLLAIGTFMKYTRMVRETMPAYGYSSVWIEAVSAYLAIVLDRLAERNSTSCHYDNTRDSLSGTFQRYALPINWDFAEAVPISKTAGSYIGQIEWVRFYINHACVSINQAPPPKIYRQSSINTPDANVDIIVTDPPYYDAIPYSDLMDFFYVWLRRSLSGLSPEIDAVFQSPLAPKWDHEHNDGELIDDSSRFGGNKQQSKANYEDGMARAFQACHRALQPEGRLVIVFAHKHPDAWETLVTALIRAGFVVDGSWPIQTEMGNRTRALSSAALASSVWLVCRKRSSTARPGWDNQVLEEMQANITEKLHQFWDAGIRGPDFVWAATGPALEAYSRHPIVRYANKKGNMEVSEFLQHVRRIVANFVVGRVLNVEDGENEITNSADNITTYYLLHRNDFGMESTPVGPCILYAVSCNLSDTLLFGKYDLLKRTGGNTKDEEDDEIEGDEEEEGTSSTVRLKTWNERRYAGMDVASADSTMQPELFKLASSDSQVVNSAVPLIDCIHRLMHLWQAGDVRKVDEYIDRHGLNANPLFLRVVQAVLELAAANSEERSLLESISNHVMGRRALPSAVLNYD